MAPLVSPLITGTGGGWFSDLGNIFSWGGGNEPPAMPQFTQAPQVPISAREGSLPPPNIPAMPPVPGRMSPEGGNPGGYDMTAAEDAPLPPVAASQPMQEASGKSYSFMDNPGASDALVAFGAAMLKAPNFNQGLGDAALAVNQVARSYRMPTEADYARARQLGTVARISRGYDDNSQAASGLEVDRSTMYRGADGNSYFGATLDGKPGLLNQDTGQFVEGGVPGITRDVYDYNSNRGRRAAGKDADIEAEFVEKIPGIASTASQFDQLYKLAADDSTGIDSSFTTRVGRQLTTLLPEAGALFTGLDPNNITEFNNRIQQAALQYASNSFKGQGQVTENEREMINRAVGQPGTLTKQSAMLVFKIMRDAEIRKLKMYQEWSRSPELRDSYGNSFARYQAEVITNATLEQMQAPSGNGASAPAPSAGGSTSSGITWSVTE